METYVPTTPGGGILGGQSADGELDGIQAWKKGLKEKEKKEKEAEQTADAAPKVTSTSAESATSHPPPPAAEGPLDEIQLFKLMMKRDAARKDSDPSPVLTSPGPLSTDRHSPAKLREASAPTPGGNYRYSFSLCNAYNINSQHQAPLLLLPPYPLRPARRLMLLQVLLRARSYYLSLLRPPRMLLALRYLNSQHRISLLQTTSLQLFPACSPLPLVSHPQFPKTRNAPSSIFPLRHIPILLSILPPVLAF